MDASRAVALVLTAVWLGMVLAISFIETPLKFRAPGVTLPIGLGIGRLVFRALNIAEVVLLVAVATALVLGQPGRAAALALTCAAALLLAQLLAVRPALTRRSDDVLAGSRAGIEAPRSRAHLAYVALELAKVTALVWACVALAAG